MTSRERENQPVEVIPDEPISGDFAQPPPTDGSTPMAPAIASPATKPRDRIVILGRRRAGKTIYLARLYEQLWKSNSHLHMRAISGETHKACMQVMDDLRKERWPASTLGAQYSDIEVSYRGSKHLLVALDYPGEVFKKAFVDNADTEDAKELLDHVDRAAAVILLLDPAVIQSESIDESIDDEFGMVQAIHRIREWSGGETVPIVMVFTKSDVRKNLLRQNGGLKEYAATRYMNLVRAMGRFKVFACAAVNSRADEFGKSVPNVENSPIGVIEPLEYCLKKIVERDDEDRERHAAQERVEEYQRRTIDEFIAHRKAILFWSIFWSVAVVVIAAIAIITWILTHGPEVP